MTDEIQYVNDTIIPNHALVILHDIDSIQAVHVVPREWLKKHDLENADLAYIIEQAGDPEVPQEEWTSEETIYRRILDELYAFPELKVLSGMFY